MQPWTSPLQLLVIAAPRAESATNVYLLYETECCALAAPMARTARVGRRECLLQLERCSAHTWRSLYAMSTGARHEACKMRPSSYARQLIGCIGLACLLLGQARPVSRSTASDGGAAAANSHTRNPCVHARALHHGSATAASSHGHGALICPPTGTALLCGFPCASASLQPRMPLAQYLA